MSMRPSSGGGPKLRRLNMGQVFILLAVASAVVTIFVFKSLVSPKAAPEKVVKMETRPLVVATQQLFSGEVINPDSLKVIDWPIDHYPQIDVYESKEKLIGRVVKSDIYPGEPVYRPSLAGENSAGGLPVVIPSGYRAMTIQVSETKGVGGFIKPGDHVDIVGNFEFQIPDSAQKAIQEKTGGVVMQNNFQITQTVLQNVQVLAIAQEMYEKKNTDSDQSDKKPDSQPTEAAAKAKLVSSITLAVSPDQAEKLSFADSQGDLRLTLRPENEKEEVHLIGAVSGDVVPLQNVYEKVMSLAASSSFGGPPPAAPSSEVVAAPVVGLPPAPPVHQVEIIEGDKKNSMSF